MTKRSTIYVLVLLIGILTLSSCNRRTLSPINTATISNSNASEKKPYLLLISLDGFRWDYVEKFNPPHLSNFIKNGVKAASLIPSFPSKTFPNHYTIVTGMYPDNHGLLGNSFYSNNNNLIYKIGNREMVEDGTFYGGSPIWLQANKANMVSASYFFVGSEANIQGVRPSYYHRYDGSIKNVQDIKEGEYLMGDDSNPRKVLSLARGKDMMYDIIPIKGDKYTVNKEHILCLKVSGFPKFSHSLLNNNYNIQWVEDNKYQSKTFTYNNENKNEKKEIAKEFLKSIKNEQILEISVKDYLNLSNKKKEN